MLMSVGSLHQQAQHFGNETQVKGLSLGGGGWLNSLCTVPLAPRPRLQPSLRKLWANHPSRENYIILQPQ